MASAEAGFAPVTIRSSVCVKESQGLYVHPFSIMVGYQSRERDEFHLPRWRDVSGTGIGRGFLDGWAIPGLNGVEDALFLLALCGEASYFAAVDDGLACQRRHDARKNGPAVAHRADDGAVAVHFAGHGLEALRLEYA